MLTVVTRCPSSSSGRTPGVHQDRYWFEGKSCLTAPAKRNRKVKFGAGEGIRTLDPNLGKVALLRDLTSRSLR